MSDPFLLACEKWNNMRSYTSTLFSAGLYGVEKTMSYMSDPFLQCRSGCRAGAEASRRVGLGRPGQGTS